MLKNMRYTALFIVLTVIIASFILNLETVKTPRIAAAERGASRLSQLLSDAGEQGFAQATGSRQFHFPADHGPHPAYRNEWWYLTGNLDTTEGRRFGYELTIFRFGLAPVAANTEGSAWRSNQVFIGHFAISDIEHDQFHVAQRYSRGSLGLAGTVVAPFSVWVEDWSIGLIEKPGNNDQETDYGKSWQLQAADGDVSLRLDLLALKAPVLHGTNGLSQKSHGAGNASFYYSMPRLQSNGTLSLGGVEYPVSGLSWLDREWSSNGLGPEQAGWDWFALQLDDGSELMFYVLRGMDGTWDTHSAGTFVAANGQSFPLAADGVTIETLEHWESPHGVRYPAAWHLQSSSVELDLEIRPLMADQELETTVRYWEGAVGVNGRHAGVAVTGRGYVELTGYADTDIR